MTKKNIILVEPSDIIRQGICTILKSKSFQYELTFVSDSNQINQVFKAKQPDLLIINPNVFIQSHGDGLKIIRQEAINSGFKILALVYYFLDQKVAESFDDVIYINDSKDKLFAKLDKLLINESGEINGDGNQPLSHREIDVIKWVALGYSNREIADKLHISSHTVVSHRKNITTKLGIKSTSGLTIYAIINKLISSNDFEKTI